MNHVLITGILLLVAMAAVVEVLFAYPVPLKFYMVIAAVSLVSVFRLDPGKLRMDRFALFAFVVGILCVLYFVDWTPRKPFLRDLHRVQVGMKEAEVRRVMDGYIEGTGLPPAGDGLTTGSLDVVGEDETYVTTQAAGELALVDSLVFRHSNTGDFNADWGVVRFEKGKVVGVKFYPD